MITQIVHRNDMHYQHTDDNLHDLTPSDMRTLMVTAMPCRWYLHIGTYGTGPQATIADHKDPDCATSERDIIGPCIGVFDSVDEVIEAAHAHLRMASCTP